MSAETQPEMTWRRPRCWLGRQDSNLGMAESKSASMISTAAISAPSGTSRTACSSPKPLLYFRVANVRPLLPWWASLLVRALARAPGASAITIASPSSGDLPKRFLISSLSSILMPDPDHFPACAARSALIEASGAAPQRIRTPGRGRAPRAYATNPRRDDCRI